MTTTPMEKSPELLDAEIQRARTTLALLEAERQSNQADADADAEFVRAVAEIFESATSGPIISGVHSWGFSDDNITLQVMCDAPDGTTIIWNFTPGQPVTPQFFD